MEIELRNVSSKLIIGGDDHIKHPNLRKDIDTYLSVSDSTGAYFAAKKKGKKYISGKYKFMTKENRIPTGFLPLLLSFLDSYGVDVHITDLRVNVPDFAPKEDRVYEFGDYNMKAYPYDHQGDMMDKIADNTIHEGLLDFPRGILDAATNAGKNTIAMGLFANTTHARCLFLVHRQLIFDQVVKFFRDEMGLGWQVGTVGGGKPPNFQNLTVCMHKSLDAATQDRGINKIIKTEYNMLIVDECHRAGAKDYAKVIRKIEAGARYFVSGSPFDVKKKLNRFKIIGLSGNVIESISKRELMDKGVSENVTVRMLHVKHPDTITLGAGALSVIATSYDEVQRACIYESEERKEVMLQKAKEHEQDSILVAFWSIDHGTFLYDCLCEQYGEENVGLLHGQLKTHEKEQVVADYASGKIRILVASTVFAEGMNIKHIKVVFYCIGGEALIPVKQFMGREERKNDGTGVIWYDFYDDVEYLDKHSRKRIRAYKQMALTIEYNYTPDRWGKPKKQNNGKKDTQTKIEL